MSSSDITALMTALKTVSNPSALKNQLDNQQGPGFRDYMDQSSRNSESSSLDRVREDRFREDRARAVRPAEDRVAKNEARDRTKPHRVDDKRPDTAAVEKRSSDTDKRKDGISNNSAKEYLDKSKEKDRAATTKIEDDAVTAEVSVDDSNEEAPPEVFAAVTLPASTLFDESSNAVHVSAKPQFGTLDILATEGDLTLDSGEGIFLGEGSGLLAEISPEDGLELGQAAEGVTLSAASPASIAQASVAATALTSIKTAVGGEAILSAANNADSEVELADLLDGEEGEADPLLEVKAGNKIQVSDAGVLPGRTQGTKGIEAIKLDAATAAVASKATIEHAQGTSTGLNHSYLTDRGAQVQGRAIMQNPMMAKEWNAEMAEKVAWFAAKNISSAEIRLDPPELGSLHIRININHEQGQAQVNFSSPHQNVREALDQSANRLREMFESQGLDLVDVDVGSQQHPEADDESGDEELVGIEGELDEELESTAAIPVSSNLVDSYA